MRELTWLLTGLLLCAVAGAWAAEYACDFAPADADRWELRSAGGATATFRDGTLRLDLTAPNQDKQAWARLQPLLKVPASLEWDQRLAPDSPHCYGTGLALEDVAGHVLIVGLCGQPQENRAQCGPRRTEQALKPGEWCRFRLELPSAAQARLTVTAAATGAEVWRTATATDLRGLMLRLTFYHNQRPAEGPDQYPQDRGASEYRRLRLTAAAVVDGSLDQYRDADLRGGDPHAAPTYNRATVWLGAAQGVVGTVLAYDRGADLPLTGTRQVASWLPNRLCEVRPTGPTTSLFRRPGDLDGYDQAALKCLQWHLGQHPVLRYRLAPRAGQCYLRVCIPEPYLGDGLELFRTAPGTAVQENTLDLAPLFAARGLDYHQFQELGIYVYQDRPPAGVANGEAEVELRLVGSGALVSTPSIVRTVERARAGVPVYAFVTGPDGAPLRGEQVQVTATCGRQQLALRATATPGLYTATLKGLAVGDHTVKLTAVARDGWRRENQVAVTVTQPTFATWKPGCPTYQVQGKPVPTMLGDLYAWAPMLDPASPHRRVIASAAEYAALSSAEQGRVGLIKNRTLTRSEIRRQLEVHAANGFRVLRLAYNVTPHEAYLDAGGHVALQGLETLQAVLGECRRLGLRVLLNVFHYPYGSPGTGSYQPWQQYVEAGYTGEGAFTDLKLWPLERQYLTELLTVVRDDPALLGYSLTGENDQAYGPEFINRLFDHVRAVDPNHVVTLEQGGGAQHCQDGNPWAYAAFKPASSGGLGYRTYYTEGMKSDAYFMVCGRFYAANPPAFLAEVASGPGWYDGFARTWTHPDFLTKVRDNCWASLLCQQTMCLTWSAPWTQEERLIPQTCADLVDWTRFRRARPDVALVLEKLDKPTIRRLAEYEAALARLGVDYDYVFADHRPARAYPLEIKVGESDLPALPPAVLDKRPVLATGERSVSYLLDADRRQMIAYVRNTAEYKLGPGYGTGVLELHRQRSRARALTVTLQGFPAGSRWRVYDVDERKMVAEGKLPAPAVDLGETSHDYAVVVRN